MTQALAPELRSDIAKAMRVQTVSKGVNIITYGDEGKEYYILSKGSVKVIVYQSKTDKNDPNLESKISFTKDMKEGCGFGELALIYNHKRSATIVAAEDCELFVLDGVLFK